MGYLSDIVKQLSKEQNVIFAGTGVTVENKEGKLSLACRTDKGQWSLPGGSLEIGETLEECAIRELFEETGIVVKEKDLVLNSAKAILQPIIKNDRQIFIVSVAYRTKIYDITEFSMDSREFTKYGWLSIEEIDSISGLITPYSVEAIDEYKKQLNRGTTKWTWENIKRQWHASLIS